MQKWNYLATDQSKTNELGTKAKRMSNAQGVGCDGDGDGDSDRQSTERMGKRWMINLRTAWPPSHSLPILVRAAYPCFSKSLAETLGRNEGYFCESHQNPPLVGAEKIRRLIKQ